MPHTEVKYNEALCQQVREGLLAIENTDADRILELHKHIWPNLYWHNVFSRFCYVIPQLQKYESGSVTISPSRPVSDFFAATPEQVKELSAMEQMIQHVNSRLELSRNVVAMAAYKLVLNKATELLTVERNREIDMVGKAWDAGWDNGSWDTSGTAKNPYPDKEAYLKSIHQKK